MDSTILPSAEFYLNGLCALILNDTEGEDNQTAVTPDEPAYEQGSLLDFLLPGSNSSNETWQFNKTEVVLRLETTTEIGIIPVVAIMGIISNFFLSIILKSDSHLPRVSYMVLQTLILCEVMFLSSVLIFVAFRRSDFRYDIDAMSYVTSTMSVCQFIMHWVFLLMQGEIYRSLEGTWAPEKLRTCSRHSLVLLAVVSIAVVIHLPFIPYIRILLFKLHPIFNPCTNPVIDLWNITTTVRKTSDWYYVLYFFLFYFLVMYALPFFLAGCKDKDIVDLLFLLKGKTKLRRETLDAAHTAMAVSVLSNLFLVCLTTKAIIIGFRIVNFFCTVFRGIHIFFYFMNVAGNVSIVARPSFNLLVFVVYTNRFRYRLRQFCSRQVVARVCRLRRPSPQAIAK